MTSLQELHDNFVRPLNLTWQLDNSSRRRLILASSVPLVLIIAMLIRGFLEYYYGLEDLLSDEFGAPRLWQRLYRSAITLDNLPQPAAALLFLAGLRTWSRAEGSWMLLVGGLLATVAVAFASVLTLVYAVTEDQEVIADLGALTLWPDIAQTFGLLAVGFFFVAYRGLSSPSAEPLAPLTEPDLETR